MGQMKLFSSFYISDVLYDLDLGGSKVGPGGRESPAMSITSTSTFFEKNADATTLLPIIQAQRERSSSSQVFTIPESNLRIFLCFVFLQGKSFYRDQKFISKCQNSSVLLFQKKTLTLQPSQK